VIEPLERNFGLIIAFLLPGFTCLCGVSAFNPTVAGWLAAEPSATPSVGGFLYVLLGSLASGLIVSAFRWALIDTLHHKTGVVRRRFNFYQLNEKMPAYQIAVEYTYRYFQFYGNMVLSVAIFCISRQLTQGVWSVAWISGFVILEMVLFFASRDCLNRYYERLSLVLGELREE